MMIKMNIEIIKKATTQTYRNVNLSTRVTSFSPKIITTTKGKYKTYTNIINIDFDNRKLSN